MTTTAQQLLQMQQNVRYLNEQRIRAEANYEQALARLKELGYDTIEDAEAVLKEMAEDIREEESRLAEDVDALLDKYPELR